MKGKVAIVTGAGKGIGRAIALDLAAQGVHVVVVSRTQSDLDSLSQQITQQEVHVLAVCADVSREKDVQTLISKVIKEFGRIDILINNAGVGYFANVADLKLDEFDEMWSINMRGVFLCAREVISYMMKQNEGDIVNISSLAGRNAFKGGAGYCATKWALIGFSRSLMLEVRENNIRVITVCPGSVDTSFGPKDLHLKDTSRIPKAEDVSRVVINALNMPRNVMVSEIDIRPTNPK